MAKWYFEKGNDGDVVLSTRVRFARNVREYPFPCKLDTEKRIELNEKIRDAVLPFNTALSYINMEDLSNSQIISMAEKHLISPEFTASANGRALILSDDEDISIMLEEEDHIRLQVMTSGFDLDGAYKTADRLDTLISESLNYAFDERIGYLTQCITNLGTGMRASLMLHLPGLTKKGMISRLSSTVSKLGLTIRGSYGEGSKPAGDIYQLSNQVTLGISEKEAIYNLESIAKQIISQERAAREELKSNDSYTDNIWRAYGILKYARQISCAEFMELISLVRVGSAMGIIDIEQEKINELIVSMQPATINAQKEQNLDPAQRDKVRAEEVRKILGG